MSLRTGSPRAEQQPASAPRHDGRRATASHRDRHGKRVAITAIVLVVALIVAIIASATIGQFPTTAADVAGSLWRAVTGREVSADVDPDTALLDAALWTIRFPRAALGLIVGACLGVAGAVMQGVFANPLAEPSIIGVNAGASVGAGVVFVFGLTAGLSSALPIAAFVGALGISIAVWALSRSSGSATVLTLILTGIAINAVAVAATSFLIFLGDAASREQIIFWQLGTLSGATWIQVAISGAAAAAGIAGCFVLRRRIDVLALGDAAAQSAGIAVERLRLQAIILVSVLTAVAVAFAGVIAFVGLIVPHALRLAVGPAHRALIPLSALGGAVLLSGADIGARTVIPFADLPIGIFTAVIGGPVFLGLLRKTLSGYRLGQS